VSRPRSKAFSTHISTPNVSRLLGFPWVPLRR
jgi:hypothetical protein